MKIANLNNLPYAATRSEWAKLLGRTSTTLARWEKRGLKSVRKNNGYVLYERDAVLKHVGLLQQMKTTLERKSDHAMPVEFFHDILDEYLSEEDTKQQIETALNWGRYAEIFEYDSENDRLRLYHAEPAVESK